MTGYTKLFSSILASTVWREDNDTRIVWITMLAMADKSGLVEASIPGLADFARVPTEACQKALAKLSSPDTWSRSKEHDGRRIAEVDGGWQILNHGAYRDKLGQDERRERDRLRKQTLRKSSNFTNVRSCPQLSANVRNVSHTEAEADTNTKAVQNKSVSPTASDAAVPAVLVFKAQGKPESWNLTQPDIDQWASDYPSLDVLAECRKARNWLDANGPRTAKGTKRFLVNWLNRSADRAKSPGRWTAPLTTTTALEPED